MKQILILVAVVIFLAGCAAIDPVPTDAMEMIASEPTEATSMPTEETIAPSTESPKLSIPHGSYCESFAYNGTGFMNYWLYIPENATPDMPLIVFLHGIGEVGRVDALENYGMISSAREIYGEEFPFIALNPCVQTDSWTSGENPAILKALIDYIVVTCEIDPDRIILTGHSLGSIGTWYMLSQYGDYFTAAVPVSCGCDELLNYDNIAKVPINAFVGYVGTYERNYANGMQLIIGAVIEAGGTGTLTVLPDLSHTDTSTQIYTAEVFEWMLSQ